MRPLRAVVHLCKGFTIFELLAVVTLLTILLPVLGGARERARRAVAWPTSAFTRATTR